MNRVHLTLIVDRSGSMGGLALEASNSINEMINEQAQSDADNVTVSMYEFDDKFDHVFGPVQVQEAPIYELKPRGMTALNDSIGRSIRDTDERILKLPETERPNKVIVAIVTDGGENASTEYTLSQVKDLVNQKENEDWEFVFIASNIDAFSTASAYNIGNTLTVAHDSQGYSTAYQVLSRSLNTVATTGATVAAAWSDNGGQTTDDSQD